LKVALHERAEAELDEHVRRSRYPGRGLVVGRSADGAAWLLLYWIMGRSPGSRARRLVAEGAVLRTEPVEAAGGDASLLFYEAMLELPGLHLVGNGDQTRTVRDALAAGGGFEAALETREREDDPPHHTPRITGLLDLRGAAPRVALSLLRANAADPALTDRHSFRPAPPPPGIGLGLTTYRGDATPLPSFRGEPLWLPLDGDAEAVLDRYWDALDAENRVALAVKAVPVTGGAARIVVRNRHPASAAPRR
jgi:hypothetical protein